MELGGEPRVGPANVSTRTLRAAIEEALIYSFTGTNLELVLAEELQLTWINDACDPSEADTKRALIDGYIHPWPLPQLVAFARQLDAEVEISETYLADLRRYIDAYDRGDGVGGPTKNLIFAANGPKPDIVLRDAVSNDIEIVANAGHNARLWNPIAGRHGLWGPAQGGPGLTVIRGYYICRSRRLSKQHSSSTRARLGQSWDGFAADRGGQAQWGGRAARRHGGQHEPR